MHTHTHDFSRSSPLDEALAAGSRHDPTTRDPAAGLPHLPMPDEGLAGVHDLDRTSGAAPDGITPRGLAADEMLAGVSPVDSVHGSDALGAEHADALMRGAVHGTDVPRGGVHGSDSWATLDLGDDPLMTDSRAETDDAANGLLDVNAVGLSEDLQAAADRGDFGPFQDLLDDDQEAWAVIQEILQKLGVDIIT
ncbi:MAG: hypothetical protein AAF772_15160 [Acidobacteriota bacterium]